MGYYGDNMGILWDIMEMILAYYWDIMGYYGDNIGILWDIVGYYGILWGYYGNTMRFSRFVRIIHNDYLVGGIPT